MDYSYLIFAHLLGVVIFAAGHGVSMAFSMLLRRESSPERLRAMLDMSLMGLYATYLGLLMLIVSGIGMGFAGGYWGSGWLWTSIVVLIAIMALMMFMGVTYFGKLRTAVGLQPYRSSRQVTLGPVAPESEIAALLAGPQAGITMGLGTLALLILLVLMVLKPF